MVTVTRIDRLARSTFDLFAIVKRIVDAGAQFRSLAEPWADTATSTGRLMIAVLGGLADVERDLIRTRTAEGRSRAQARGQHMGRPSALTPQQQAEARKRRDEGATLKELAQSYNVGNRNDFPLIEEDSRMTAVTLSRTDHARPHGPLLCPRRTARPVRRMVLHPGMGPLGLQSVEESGGAINFIRELPLPILKTEIVRWTESTYWVVSQHALCSP